MLLGIVSAAAATAYLYYSAFTAESAANEGTETGDPASLISIPLTPVHLWLPAIFSSGPPPFGEAAKWSSTLVGK